MLKKILFFTAIMAVGVCPFYGQSSAHRIAQVIIKSPNSTAAQIVPFARVIICADAPGCTTVNVYQDSTLSSAYPQPLTSDSAGKYNYYVTPGCYKEQILSPGSPVSEVPGVCVSAPNGAGGGTVTTVAISAANGLSGSVSNPSTNPTLSIGVDASHYLPLQSDVTAWNGKQSALGFTPENAANKGTPSGYAGLNSSGYLPSTQIPIFTGGDVSSAGGSAILSLPTVNPTPGVCGDSTHVCQVTTNAKGLTTAQSSIALSNVTNVSVGNLTPLFTSNVANPGSTPTVTFTLSTVNQNSVFAGPPSGGPGPPSFQTAPTFSSVNLSLFSSTAVGVVPASGGGSTNFLRADGTWAAPAGGGGGMVYPAAGIANSTGTAWGTSYSATNLIPANFLPVATTGAFGTVKPDGTTITISGGVISSVGGGGGISGLTTGYIPQATSSTAIGNSFIDYGVAHAGAYTSTKDIYAPAFHSTDTGGAGFGFVGAEGTAPAGVAGSDGLWADSTAHRLMMNNNNTGAVTVASLSDFASNSAFGVVKCGSGTTCTGGVISVSGGGGIANVTVTLPTTAIAANTCTAPATVSMPGVTTSSAFSTAFASNPSAVTGWGSSGGLVFNAWPSADTLNWEVCNVLSTSTTPGAMTLNVGAN